MRRLRLAAAAAAALLSIGSTTPVFAQEQAGAAYIAGTGAVDGITGLMGIRTDPATVVGVGYVHPTQIDVGSLGGDFLAIGTANGAGAPGDSGQSSCLNDYDARWTIYADGEIGGLYFCEDVQQDVYSTGDAPSFEIAYKTCAANGLQRWVLSLGGLQRRCYSQGSIGGIGGAVLLETTGLSTTDRNIDVKYTGVKINKTLSTAWLDFNPTHYVGPSPSYTVQIVSSTSVNAYLAPLN